MQAQSASDAFLHFVDTFQAVIGTLTDPDNQLAVAAIRGAIVAIPGELTAEESYVVRNVVTDLVRVISGRAGVHRIPTDLLAEIVAARTDGVRMASAVIRYLDTLVRDLVVLQGTASAASQHPSFPVEIGEVNHPNARRIAEVIVSVLMSSTDPKNLDDLWRCSNKAPGTLKSLCCGSGVNTRLLRQFARGLRLILLRRRDGCHPRDVLDIVDNRSRLRFLIQCGADPAHPYELPRTVIEYIEKQTFILDRSILREVWRLLAIPERDHPTFG